MPVFTLNTNPHIDTTGSYPSGTYNVGDEIRLMEDTARWYWFEWFEITGGGTSYIITEQVYWEVYYAFNMPNYDVSATPLSSLIQYNISYNDIGGEPIVIPWNPDFYTTETPTFTLINPTKSGYIFLWWAGSSWPTPQLVVTIEQGSFGDRAYYAVWEEIPPTPTWWWIMINGQALSKRYINWQEVQKIMVNGNQVRPI